MSKKILEVKNLTKYYQDILGVENLNFNLESGEVFGFIGPNGAGKSTTIRTIMNLINKTEGTILINGKELDKNDLELKEMIGYLPSEIHLYDDLTVGEMLDYHESFYRKNIHKKRMELVKRLKLDEKKKIEDLSLGNTKKLGIALALMHEPKLLILDEATSGLDPVMQQEFFKILKEEKEKGTTIFYSTHILSEVSKICDRVGIIKDGHLLKIESMEELHKKNFCYIIIYSQEIDKIMLEITSEILYQENNIIKLKYEENINSLIKKLTKYKIDKLLIEEPSIEDLFLHYYK